MQTDVEPSLWLSYNMTYPDSACDIFSLVRALLGEGHINVRVCGCVGRRAPRAVVSTVLHSDTVSCEILGAYALAIARSSAYSLCAYLCSRMRFACQRKREKVGARDGASTVAPLRSKELWHDTVSFQASIWKSGSRLGSFERSKGLLRSRQAVILGYEPATKARSSR